MYRIVTHDRFGTPLGEFHQAMAVSRSFALNRSGLLSFDLDINDPKANATLAEHANIVAVYSDEVPTWAGYITGLGWDLPNNKLHVKANSMLQRLSKARMKPAKIVGFASDHFKYIIEDANFEESKGIYLGTSFTGGESLTVEYTADNNYDRLTELLDRTKFEIDLVMESPNHYVLSLYEKLGRDLTTTIVLQSGVDIEGGGFYEEDSQTFANKIIALGKPPDDDNPPEGGYSPEEDWDRKPKGYYTNHDKPRSLNWNRFGLGEEVVEFSDIADIGTLDEMAKQEGLKREQPTRPYTFNLNKRRKLWGTFLPGDYIAVVMPKVRFTGLVVPFRVTGLEINEDGNLMTVTGDIVAGEAAQNLAIYKSAQYGSLVL